MRSLSTIILFSFGFVFLSLPSDKEPTLISLREKKMVSRKLASGDGYRCLRDRFSVEELKKEVKSLEDELDTNRISGRWRHLDLSELPTPAAYFLTMFGDKVGNEKFPASFGECEDVPCLFNVAYGTPDGIAGLVHYLWFLRTGVYLAADNRVPGQESASAGVYNGKLIPFQSYLYTEDELYGFWRLGRMLRTPHSSLTYLKEIQRVPRGEKMEGRNVRACGLAGSEGWINLADGCLIVYRRSDSGYFFPSILHELSHQIDYEDGRRYNGELYRSQRDDFLTLSGFSLTEYRDSSGAMVRQWILKPDARTVSAYARQSPAENFAELLAYYRVDGDVTKTKVNDDSYQFASAYFRDRNFEAKSFVQEWSQSALSRRGKDILRISSQCEDASCLSREIANVTQEEIGFIRSEDPDGCQVLSNPQLGQSLPGKIKTAFSQLADEFLSATTPELRGELAGRVDEVLNPNSAYEAFFSCVSLGAECFEEEVRKKKTDELSGFGDASEKMMEIYLWTHSFEKVEKEVTQFYRSLLASREGVLKLKVDELWESCRKIPPSDELPPRGNEYIVREGYMVSSFYNCLNRGFVSTLNSSLDAVKLREFSPRNSQERSFILSLLRPRFTEILDDHLRSGRAREIKIRDAFVEQHSSWMYNTMRSNRWWVPRGRVDQLTLEMACRDSAPRLIGGDIFFHLKIELYRELIEKTCQGIR